MSEGEAGRVLAYYAALKLPHVRCLNWDEGCCVTHYSDFIDLHEKFCIYQKRVNEHVVRGCLNLMRADSRYFKPFCCSFKSTKGLQFLFKKTENSLKICCGSQEVVAFTMTFYDRQKKCMSSIKGISGISMYIVDPKVFEENGNEVDFKIVIHNPELFKTVCLAKRPIYSSKRLP